MLLKDSVCFGGWKKSMQLICLMLYLEIRQCTCAVLHSAQCSRICHLVFLHSRDFIRTLIPGEFSFCLKFCSAKFISLLSACIHIFCFCRKATNNNTNVKVLQPKTWWARWATRFYIWNNTLMLKLCPLSGQKEWNKKEELSLHGTPSLESVKGQKVSAGVLWFFSWWTFLCFALVWDSWSIRSTEGAWESMILGFQGCASMVPFLKSEMPLILQALGKLASHSEEPWYTGSSSVCVGLGW